MKEMVVSDLKVGDLFTEFLSLDGKIILLEPGLAIEEDDLNILDHWKIKKLFLLDEVEEVKEDTAEAFNRFGDEKKLYLSAAEDSLREITRFYTSVTQRGLGHINDMEKQFPDILSLLKRNKDFMLLVLQMRNPNLIKFEEAAFYSSIISLIIALRVKKADGSKLLDEELKDVYISTVCANLGMVKFEKLIIRPKVPSPQEQKIMQSHTVLGYKLILEKLKLDKKIAGCVLNHHENIDGSGYPRKLPGNKISIETKIISIALDYVESMRGVPFFKKQNCSSALRMVCGGSKKKYHPLLINFFVAELSMYPVGIVVQLNDMSMGVVIGTNQKVPLRPIVKVIIDKDGNSGSDMMIINMTKENTVFINEVIEDRDIIDQVYENL